MTHDQVFDIDDDVPPPEDGPVPGGAKRKYRFAELKVGQSFFVPHRVATKMSSAVTNAKKRNPGMEFTMRTVTEEYPRGSGERVQGTRIWRLRGTAPDEVVKGDEVAL